MRAFPRWVRGSAVRRMPTSRSGRGLVCRSRSPGGVAPSAPASLTASMPSARQALRSLRHLLGIDIGPDAGYRDLYTLVYVPALRPIATLRSCRNCKALASELARTWVRWDGAEPFQDPAPLLQRFQREEV